MTQRYYSSTAVQTTGTAGISNVQTTMTVAATTGWPTQYPFLLILEESTGSEELVDVTNVSGLTITMTRGVDGTAAVTHNNGFTVRHGISGRDLRNSRDHENAVSGVHGVVGNVVGDTDAQTLTNKSLTSPTITGTFPTHTHADGTTGGTIVPLTTHIGLHSGVHGVTGNVVGDVDVQSLSNKTLIGPLVNPAATNSKGLLVRGLALQTDNISEVQTSDGTPRWWIDGNGRAHLGTAVTVNSDAGIGVAALTAAATDATAAAVVAQGANSQTAAILAVKDSSGTNLATFDASGNLRIPGLTVTSPATLQAGVTVIPPSSSTVVAHVQGAASQTADLQRWENSSGTALASISAAGALSAPNLPFAECAGTQDFVFSGSVGQVQIFVNFPAGRFSVPPLVTVTLASASAGARFIQPLASSISTSGCNITCITYDASNAAAATHTVHYRAVQMTSATAAG